MLGFCFNCSLRFEWDENGDPLCVHCRPPMTWGDWSALDQPEYIDRGDDLQAPFTVLADTREQRAYTFLTLSETVKNKTLPLRVNLEKSTLAAGDYSIGGYADKVAVERKTFSDFCGSFGSGRVREERKLRKLAAYTVAWYMLEFTNVELLSGPPVHSKVNTFALHRSIMAYEVRYPTVHWIYAGNRERAEKWTYRLLEKWWNEFVGRPMKEAARAENKKMGA